MEHFTCRFLLDMAAVGNAVKYSITKLSSWSPQTIFIRHRYYAEKVARGPVIRRYGYEENILQKGFLPRDPKATRVKPMPLYVPKDSWVDRRALFGQNDYIDILGNDKVHPTRILYNMPRWLRGVGGHEFQIMLRKQKMLGQTTYPLARPTKWYQLSKRIRWLHKYLNNKTRTW